MRKDSIHLGSAKLLSATTLTAGLPATTHIVYTVGRYGLDENAGIRLAWRSVSDWEQPQFQDPSAFGFSSVYSNNAQTKLVPAMIPYQRPFHNSLVIKVREAPLFEGDEIHIILGDTSKGSPGLRTQSFAESAHEIKVLVDPFNTNRYEPLTESLRIQVKASPANEIHLVAPSRVVSGKPFEMTLRVLDEWGNPCKDFSGDISLSVLSGSADIPDMVQITPDDKGFKRFGGCTAKEGTVYFQADHPQLGLHAISNACTCEAHGEYKLFWGDMHGQTDLTVGTGSLDEYFQFAQGPAALDVSGWQGNDLEVTPQKWEEVKRVTKKYHQPHRFLTFLGYEWSGNFPGGGDHNIYFLGDDGDLYPSSHWSTTDVFDETNSCDRYPLNELFDTFRGRDDVMIIPHIGGRPANLDYFDPEFTPAIEIHSHHGTFEWFAHDAMRRKLKVGFLASSDDHTCRLGLSYALQNTGQAAAAFDTKSGLVGIYAKELTREAIWEALKARRCFAVTYNRIDLQVKIGDLMMGQEGTVSQPPSIRVDVKGTAPLDHIDIFRGNDIVHTWRPLPLPTSKRRVKLLWSGVRNTGRSKSAKWDGTLYLDEGKICSISERAFDTFQQGVTSSSAQIVSWKSSTSGDIDGLILDIDAPDSARLHFTSKLTCFDISLGELSAAPTVFNAGGENLKVEISLAGGDPDDSDTDSYCQQLSWEDAAIPAGQNAYWVKVVQSNGQMAYSSPIFIEKL